MIDEVVKQQSRWLRYANSICKNTDNAKDLVQEMYLKLIELNLESVNAGYIYKTIKTLFLINRKENEIFEFDINGIVIESVDYDDTDDNDKFLKLSIINESFQSLPKHRIEIIEESFYTKGITVNNPQVKRQRKLVKQWAQEKYKELEMLSQK